jgi:hypothetical protein
MTRKVRKGPEAEYDLLDFFANDFFAHNILTGFSVTPLTVRLEYRDGDRAVHSDLLTHCTYQVARQTDTFK